MARFDHEQIDGHMADSPAITVTLPQGGVYLLLCALTTMNKQWQWRSGEDDLPDYNWDILDEYLSELSLAIGTEVDGMSLPIGIVVPFPVTATPAGFLLCNGDQYLRVDYPLLYAVLAPAYIVDADNFTVPDLDSSFIRGIGDGSDDPGDTGGEAGHQLTIPEMPSHNHAIMYEPNTVGTGALSRMRVQGGSTWSETTIGVTGQGATHNNLPPYTALPYYIKAE